ncbi:hypothetical protein [Streptomyces sp. NPDC093568]
MRRSRALSPRLPRSPADVTDLLAALEERSDFRTTRRTWSSGPLIA